jgi:type IV pilus assembly protein PilC
MAATFFFEPRARWKSLALWCRSLGTMLYSGVHLLKALKISGGQTSDARLQSVMKAVVDDLQQGEDIATALKNQGSYFPELVTDMVQVAEKTGALPEVFGSLADHYENLLRLRKMFLSQIAWPVFQLLVAIFVIAGLIVILGFIGESTGRRPLDVLGLGLFGVSGALTWLGYCFGTAALLWMAYMFVVRGLRQQALVHGLLLKIPIVGDCLRSFAVARFAWAYALTQQAGMDVKPSLEASFKATNNGAFLRCAPLVTTMVMEGENLTDALRETKLFPPDVIEMIRVGETSGTIPETLQHLGPQFEERARRALSLLTVAFGWLVWLFVAGMITFFIFRIALFYIGMIHAAASGNFDALD